MATIYSYNNNNLLIINLINNNFFLQEVQKQTIITKQLKYSVLQLAF